MENSVAVIVAHPDDEILGCGGAVARHAEQGDEVHVLIMAEGATSRALQRSREDFSGKLEELGRACHKANKILGVTSVTLLDFPDNRLDSCDRLDLTKAVEKFVEEKKSTIVYTHHCGDVNVDHRRVHEAVVTACRPLPGASVQTLLYFETLSSTEWQTPGSASYFMPNYFIDIEKFLAKKIEALREYHSEMRLWPHSRSYEAIEHLARFRGVMAGVSAAEAFSLGRKILS